MHNIPIKYRTGFIYVALALATLAVFWQVHTFEFLNYDDQTYVHKNEHISPGLTQEGIIWVFAHAHGGNWHPLTGLSHMLDCELFGLNPGWHHLVNVLFHIANALLLFGVLRQMTGAIWQSAFVAALFAIHPLHVQSVAWIAERKDVLSTLFWFLTMAAYFHYVKNPKISRYISALVLFTLGLMAKPMLVTLPFVLLLLDYWPLNRFEVRNKGQIYRLVQEKIPLFILSAGSSIVTFLIQKSSGAVTSRVANAIISYFKYIEKMIWPRDLSVFYPYDDNFSVLAVLVVAAILIAITFMVMRLGGKYKYLPVGWFWYLGTLVPVIGLVQVGEQAMADRYTYIPFTGLFIMIAWGFSDLLIRYHFRKKLLTLTGCAALSVLTICSFFQVGYWRNTLTLFEHVAAVTNKNYIAHIQIGLVLMDENKLEQAISHYREALRIRPDAETYNTLGATLNKLGRPQEAVEAHKSAIKLKADYLDAYNNLGSTYALLGRYEEAIETLQQAVTIQPKCAEAYGNLGAIYNQLGRRQEAIDSYRQAIKLKPDFVNAHYNLGLAYIDAEDENAALEQCEILKPLDPKLAETLRGFIK